jgi:hypothetical protein
MGLTAAGTASGQIVAATRSRVMIRNASWSPHPIMKVAFQLWDV